MYKIGCMCAECQYAGKTELPYMICCRNPDADNYGTRLFVAFDGCDSGAVEIVELINIFKRMEI